MNFQNSMIYLSINNLSPMVLIPLTCILFVIHFGSVLSSISNDNNSTSALHLRRNLQATSSTRESKKFRNKQGRAAKLLIEIEKTPIPDHFVSNPESASHNPSGPAVFTSAMDTSYSKFDATMFAGSLRDTGYSGDIVVAVSPGSDLGFLSVWKHYRCVVYTVQSKCVGEEHDKKCSFDIGDGSPPVSINMLRFYMYQWWGRKYQQDALILVSDFRDVFFQSNPFTYKPQDWAPPVAQFVAFQEAYPNKVINRCIFNGGWIRGCYGEEGLQRVGTNTVSCSGNSIANKDALVIYAYLMVQQLNPQVRYGKGTTKSNDACVTGGMDQGFHNWLLYTGELEKYMDLKIFQQGEGPVNTIGSFFGQRIILKIPLTEWGVMKGAKGSQMIYNWNGDVSPVVHQSDRFLFTQMDGMYDNLAVGKKMAKLMQEIK